jgi:hypothetical protein
MAFLSLATLITRRLDMLAKGTRRLRRGAEYETGVERMGGVVGSIQVGHVRMRETEQTKEENRKLNVTWQWKR